MTNDHSPVPRRRATDAERSAAADALGRALTDGQLSPSEFEERSKLAWAAAYRDELPALLADLATDPESALSPRSEAGPAAAGISPSTTGRNLTVEIMGGSTVSGDWQCAPAHTSINIMGGSDIDFSGDRLSATRTVLTTIDVMGGADIRVPENVRIETGGFALMGGMDVKDAPGVTMKMGDLPADAPTIVIRSYSLVGGSDVLRVPVPRERK